MAQASFSIAASGDDGYTQTSAATYPPGGSVTVNTTGISMVATNTLSGATFVVRCLHMRFDTSSLPDNAVVTGATLRLFSRSAEYADNDARNLVGEWRDPGVLDATDHTTAGVGTDAFNVDLTTVGHANATVDIALSNPTNVNLSGFTGFRIGISGGQPTAANECGFAQFDHTTQAEPVLIVDYTIPTAATAGRLLLQGVGS